MGRRKFNEWPIVVCTSVIGEAGRRETVATLDVTAALKREN